MAECSSRDGLLVTQPARLGIAISRETSGWSRGKSTDNGVDFGFEHTKVLSAHEERKFCVRPGHLQGDLPLTSDASTQPQTGVQQLYRFTGNGTVSY